MNNGRGTDEQSNDPKWMIGDVEEEEREKEKEDGSSVSKHSNMNELSYLAFNMESLLSWYHRMK